MSPRTAEDTGAQGARAYSVVVPTVGRPSLHRLLRDLAAQRGPGPQQVLVVDDRPLPGQGPVPVLDLPELPWPVRVLRTGGRGPAAARNAGWRSATTPWVAFLDDDVRLPDGWADGLATDLGRVATDVAGVQGRIEVPLPPDRPATDWERNTAGLERARWATADMAYRRETLAAVDGFDERFPLAYREDADLALRVRRAGWRLERGRRHVVHPARPASWDVSLRVQRGAASDALMRALHGPRWRARAATGRGRLRWHLATVASAAGAGVLLAAGQRRAATVAGLLWAGLTADFTARRITPGPGPGTSGWPGEWARMAVTSVAIPFAAVWHRTRGELACRRGVAPWPPPARAVLFDRDGTLIHDVPYNGDPERVEPVAGADEAVRLLRGAGLRVGLVSNQSAIGRGLLREEQVAAVNTRVEELLGRLDTLQYCPHHPEAGCPCRKPGAGLVLAAAAELGVQPHECVVVGDIGADVEAARAAGARAVLVPNGATRPEEVAGADLVAADLREASDLVLAAAGGGQR